MDDFLFVFGNTHDSIKSDKRLQAVSIPATVTATPGRISDGCGICLKVKKDNLNNATEAISAINVRFKLYRIGVNKNEYFQIDSRDGNETEI